MCTAYAVRQHRLSVLVKVFSRSRARTGAAGSARSRPERSAAPAASTERSTTRAVAARSRPIRRPGGLRLEVGQTRSCIPRSDAPGRTSGSRRIHVPHDRRPTALTSSTPSHAAATPREPNPPSGMPDRPLCRSPYRHARGVVAGRESCYESIPTIAKNLRIRDGIS